MGGKEFFDLAWEQVLPAAEDMSRRLVIRSTLNDRHFGPLDRARRHPRSRTRLQTARLLLSSPRHSATGRPSTVRSTHPFLRGFISCNRVQERSGGLAYIDFRGPGGTRQLRRVVEFGVPRNLPPTGCRGRGIHHPSVRSRKRGLRAYSGNST